MMKKTMLTIVAFVMSLGMANAQLLYKVTGNGLEKPSFIVGTHHLANHGFVNEIKGATDAIMQTDRVCGEVNTFDMTNPDTLQVMQQSMLLPEGVTLRTLLTEEQMGRLNAMLKKITGADMNNEMVFQQMGRMKPAVLATTLQILLFVVNGVGKFNPNMSIDQYFQMQARNNNEPVIGLETTSYQMQLLFSEPPMDRQVENLMCLVDNEAWHVEQLRHLASAYYAQDIKAVEEAINERIGNACDATAAEEERLIYGRNAKWMEVIPSLMQEMPTLFVVGAGHLGGERGLLQLLREKNYTVEGVK